MRDRPFILLWTLVKRKLEVAYGAVLNIASGGQFQIGGTQMTASAAELNQLDGAGAVKADFEKLHALTASAAQVNSLVYSPGLQAMAVLRVAANVADGETVVIGADTYEVDIINTDSTDDTGQVAGDFNNVTDPLTVDMTLYTNINGVLAVGDLMRIENEILKVTDIVGSSYTFARGRCGTTAAAHADGSDIYISDAPGMAHIPVGLVADLTPAVFTNALIDEINSDAGTEAVNAVDISDNIMLLLADAVGVNVTSLAHTLGGADNGWDTAALRDGQAAGLKRVITVARVPNAQEVALDRLMVPLPFTPTAVHVSVYTTATTLPVAWDGELVIQTNRVDLLNGGTVDWSAAETIYITAIE